MSTQARSFMKSKLPIATYEQVVVALFSLGWLASVVVAAHHHDKLGNGIFFVDPFLAKDSVRQIELVLFIAGWVMMCLGPIFIAIRMLLSTDAELRYLRAIALFYPASVFLIQVTLYYQSNHFQKPYSYLSDNYWFIVTDVVVPVGLFVLDLIVRRSRQEDIFIPEGESASLVSN